MEKRAVVIAFFQQGKKHNEIYNLLDKKKYFRQFIKYTINRYLETGSINDRKRTGKPRTVRTNKMIEKVRSALKLNSNRSQRKLVNQYEKSKTTKYLQKTLGSRLLKNQSAMDRQLLRKKKIRKK